MIYLNLFYGFMILFQCNNVVILILIIFCLNCNQHIIDIRYFEILQYRTRLSTSFIEFASIKIKSLFLYIFAFSVDQNYPH
jgi:hypothetical protein